MTTLILYAKWFLEVKDSGSPFKNGRIVKSCNRTARRDQESSLFTAFPKDDLNSFLVAHSKIILISDLTSNAQFKLCFWQPLLTVSDYNINPGQKNTIPKNKTS
jgi:hypothetical protein